MSERTAEISRRHFFVLTGVVAADVAIQGCASTPELPAPIADCGGTASQAETAQMSGPIDLLQAPWNVAGVETMKDGALAVAPIDMAIFGKDNLYHPNPQRNAETALHFAHDFAISADVTLPEKSTLQLFVDNELPLIYDDFLFPRRGACITIDTTGGAQSLLTIKRWDGIHQEAIDEQTLYLANTDLQKTLSFAKQNGQLVVTIDEQRLVLNDNGQTFADGKVWLGLVSSGADTPTEVTQLQAKSLDNTPATLTNYRTLTTASCVNGLRDYAERKRPGFRVGAAAAAAPWISDPRYAGLLGTNFNAITTENALKPQFVQPQEGHFTLQEAQLLIQLAKNNGMSVHGHALVPNRSFPEWMANAPVSRLRQIMVDHITGVVTPLAGLVQSYDVVNEPLADDSSSADWRQTMWYKACRGDSYINIAFQAAHKADPRAELWLNDYAMDKETAGDEARFQALFKKAVDLLSKNIPITGIGFEGHVYEIPRDSMSAEALTRRMKQLGSVGLKARVSEMDVTPADTNGNITAETLALQAAQFREIFQACLAAPNCVGFTTWGVGGLYVSTTDITKQGTLSSTSHTLWDDRLRQRPAYAALRQS